MRTRRLGRTPLDVSVIGLGCSNFGSRVTFEAARDAVHAALENGITFFDTADVYGNRGGSERWLGELLGARRKDLVLGTKFGRPMEGEAARGGASRKHIMAAVEGSLMRLRTDWIDLYQIHWPDPDTPIEETLRALDDLVRSGKVRYAGCSNFSACEVAEADDVSHRRALVPFASDQAEYSLLARDAEAALLPELRARGMSLLPYLPLAGGMLSGKYAPGEPVPPHLRLAIMPEQGERYLTERNWARLPKLAEYAASRGRTLLDLAIAWVAAEPAVASVLLGATSGAQVARSASAAAWVMSEAERSEVSTLAG